MNFFVNTNSSRINQSIIGNTACTYDVLQNMFQFLAESLTVFLIGIYLVWFARPIYCKMKEICNAVRLF